MSTPSFNEFQSFTFNEREQAESLILNQLQRERIFSERARIAGEMLKLEFDHKNPTEFGIQQSYLRGQLDAFTWLIDADPEAQIALRQLIANNPED